MEKIIKRSGKKKKLTYAQIFHFFEQLRALLGAGITPYAALQIMKKDTDNADISALLDGLSSYVADGRQLSEAVRASGVFPDYVTELLILGEHSGKMEDVCGALARYYEDQDDLRSAIRGAVSYPIVMVGMMFVVVLVLLSRVMPVFAQVFNQLGTSVSGVTKALMDLSDALTKYYVVLIVIFAVLVLLFLYFYCTERGQQQFARLLQKCPLTSRFTEDMALTRFAEGMQMTSSAGLDPYASLDLVSRLVGNEAVEKKVQECRTRLLEGDRFTEAVSSAGLFNSFYAGMIDVFAQSGSVDS
ncbi:MAG: type II secretion system F family protein, partial [Stomatobaculum sp.]|nr:type II secretion system F family protein [Stomatobaculum sp.]